MSLKHRIDKFGDEPHWLNMDFYPTSKKQFIHYTVIMESTLISPHDCCVQGRTQTGYLESFVRDPRAILEGPRPTKINLNLKQEFYLFIFFNTVSAYYRNTI